MWRQLLFWAIMGPRHFRRFVVLWLLAMAFFFYCFVHEAFEGRRAMQTTQTTPVTAR